MKKHAQYVSALFFLVVIHNCHSMTVLNRTGQAGQRTSNVFGARSYGWGQSRSTEQAIQAAKTRRATEAIAEQDRELNEYFRKKPYLLNSDVLNRKSTEPMDSYHQAVSLAEKTNQSWFERLKNAFYSLFTTSSSRTIEQAIQEDNTRRFNEWWKEQDR